MNTSNSLVALLTILAHFNSQHLGGYPAVFSVHKCVQSSQFQRSCVIIIQRSCLVRNRDFISYFLVTCVKKVTIIMTLASS